jgi:hypothetical protein
MVSKTGGRGIRAPAAYLVKWAGDPEGKSGQELFENQKSAEEYVEACFQDECEHVWIVPLHEGDPQRQVKNVGTVPNERET